MTSSTSHSNRGKLHIGWTVGFSAIVAWIACIFYSIHGNPEIVLFKNCVPIKEAWVQKLSREFDHKTIMYGGSSTTFSIDPTQALEKHRFPLANLGLGAGIGSRVLTRFALSQTKAGDTLVVAFEPGLLSDEATVPSLGIQVATAMGHPEYAANCDLDQKPAIPWLTLPGALRPGGYHSITMVGKILRRQPIYRYKISDFHEDGRQRTEVRVPIETAPNPSKMSESTRNFMRSLVTYCREHNIKVCFSLPWKYSERSFVESGRRANARILTEVIEIMPVLRDPFLGVYEERSHFADTPWHLDGEGAVIRTDQIVQTVRNWEMWTKSELEQASLR